MSKKNVERELAFRVFIKEGHAIKLLLSTLANYTGSMLSMTVDPKKITFVEVCEEKNCNFFVSIDGTKTPSYFCAEKKTFVLPITAINVDLRRSLRRNDRVAFIIYKDDLEKIYLEIFPPGAQEATNELDYPISLSRVVDAFEMPQYNRTIVMESTFLRERCKGMESSSPEVRVESRKPGSLEFVNGANNSSNRKKYHTPGLQHTDTETRLWKLYAINLESRHFSSLVKICYNKENDIFFRIPANGLPLCVELPVGSIGNASFFLREKASVDQLDEEEE